MPSGKGKLHQYSRQFVIGQFCSGISPAPRNVRYLSSSLQAKTDSLRIALSEPITNRENTIQGYFKQKEAVPFESLYIHAVALTQSVCIVVCSSSVCAYFCVERGTRLFFTKKQNFNEIFINLTLKVSQGSRT